MNKENIISKIDFAFILAILSVFCYGLSYLYTAGQLRYYNIPLYFMDIDAKAIFFTLLSMNPIIIGTLVNYAFNKDSKSSNENHVGSTNKKHKASMKKDLIQIVFFTLLIIGVVSFFIFEMGKQSTVLLILLFFQFVAYVIVTTLNRIRKYLYLVVTIFLFSLILPFSYGLNSSYTKTEYLTFESNKELYVVLAYYKDHFVYAPLDKKKNEYKNEFHIIEIKDVKGFREEPLGYLKKQKSEDYH